VTAIISLTSGYLSSDGFFKCAEEFLSTIAVNKRRFITMLQSVVNLLSNHLLTGMRFMQYCRRKSLGDLPS
jgi:hypothetical protein